MRRWLWSTILWWFIFICSKSRWLIVIIVVEVIMRYIFIFTAI